MRKKVVLTYKDLEGNFAEETIWVFKVGENSYRVDNIPFFAPNIAFYDIISIEEDNGVLYFNELLEESGNSTVQIVFFDEGLGQIKIKELGDLGCGWEGMKGLPIYAVEIPREIDYNVIKTWLSAEFSKGVLDYKEACLSQKHFMSIK